MKTLLDALAGGPDMDKGDARFRFAPEGWTVEAAREMARQEGLELEEDHWVLIHALQEFCARHEDHSAVKMLELRDALEEKFHYKGGIKYLYFIFPGGPVAQGCRLAGLKAPPGAQDFSYGNVS